MTDKEFDALASFWAMFWAALVLNPRRLQNVRWMMVRLGLVKPRGRLALTPLGKRIIKRFQEDKP